MIYDKAYYEKYVERGQTELGQAIYSSRWDLVEKYCHGKMSVLDYGCGPGCFNKASRNGFITYGYDINPFCGFPDVPRGTIDILTMWDSIEHLVSPWETIKVINPEYIFIATPNVNAAGDDITQWKHYRPEEHLHYFNLQMLTENLGAIGYEILEHNFVEGELRDYNCPEAIITVVAKKRIRELGSVDSPHLVMQSS